jgi:uncharacterized protein (TIGR02147 family)
MKEGEKNPMKRPVVYDYRDYRAFLKDTWKYRKKQKAHFSYRLFSKKAGFSSPNFLKLVIDGQRNLTNESVAKIARGFDLKKQEREFFENLVFMNQAADLEEKNHYYRKMMSVGGNLKIRKLERAFFEYFSKWYYPAVREIVMLGSRDHTAKQVASMLMPSITVREARKALRLLQELGFIRKDKDGRWEQCDKALTTGPEVRSLAVANFHREMLKRADDAIERFAAHERDISGLTLSTTGDKIAELKKKIVAFRKEVLNLVCDDDVPDEVVQLNIQMFPLADSSEREE